MCDLNLHPFRKAKALLIPSFSLWKFDIHILAKCADVVVIVRERDSLHVPRATCRNDMKNIHRVEINVMFQTQISRPVK